MTEATGRLDLGRLSLTPGEGRRVDGEVAIEPLELGGQTYSTERPVSVRLDVSRTMAGYALRLRASVLLAGPCVRCLEGARSEVPLEAREVDQPGGGEDLSSPYVDGDDLDLHAWARDTLVLALPAQVVCADDCLGLCATCGENLNRVGPEHGHEPELDPRWAALRELRIE
jgi:uncharacterized protein